MSLDPPKVLLERTFLHGLADRDHQHHLECAALYRDLVDRFERDEVLLFAVGDHLREFELGPEPGNEARARWFLHRRPRGLFAAVDPLHVGFQHRRAARATEQRLEVAPSVALTLVLCDRAKIRRVATLDQVYSEYDLERLDLPVG